METETDKITVAQICDKVGRAAIQQHVGVNSSSVSMAVKAGRFPARWYAGVKQLCEQVREPCPLHLFNFADPISLSTGKATEGQK